MLHVLQEVFSLLVFLPFSHRSLGLLSAVVDSLHDLSVLACRHRGWEGGEGGREGGRKGGKDGGREGQREGGTEGGAEGGREGQTEGWRGAEGSCICTCTCTCTCKKSPAEFP